MVLAQRVKLDVAHNHHVGSLVGEYGLVDNRVGILTIATCGIYHGFGSAHGGLDQSFAFYVLTKQSDYGLIVARDLCDSLV